MQVNRDLLRQRAKEVRNALAILEGYATLSQQAFLARSQVVDAAKYRLVVGIEAAISICTHLAARVAHRTPESYAECFAVLAEAGMLSADLAERLGRMARFRNLLVHLYWEVDDSRVWQALRNDLKDLDDYLVAVGQAAEEAL